jgi:hypothetical protein
VQRLEERVTPANPLVAPVEAKLHRVRKRPAMLVEEGLTQMRAWTPRLAIQAAVMTSLLDASFKQAAR